MNHDAIDTGINSIVKIEVPSSWKDAKDEVHEAKAESKEIPAFIKDIVVPMNRQEREVKIKAMLANQKPVERTSYNDSKITWSDCYNSNSRGYMGSQYCGD